MELTGVAGGLLEWKLGGIRPNAVFGGGMRLEW